MSFETTVPYKVNLNKYDSNAKEEEVFTLRQVANLIEERLQIEKQFWKLITEGKDIPKIQDTKHKMEIIDNRINRWKYTGSDNPV